MGIKRTAWVRSLSILLQTLCVPCSNFIALGLFRNHPAPWVFLSNSDTAPSLIWFMHIKCNIYKVPNDNKVCVNSNHCENKELELHCWMPVCCPLQVACRVDVEDMCWSVGQREFSCCDPHVGECCIDYYIILNDADYRSGGRIIDGKM